MNNLISLLPNPFFFSFRSDPQTRSFSAILLRTPKFLCCRQISQNSESHRKASKLMKSKIFQSLKTAAAVSCALFGAALLTACSDSKKVGDVSLGFLTFKNIQIDAFIDPQVPGVTCHAASIESPLTLADPSDSSVSCRQTGEITQAMIDAIDKSKDGEVIFTKSKSIFFKYMKIRRIYDAENQTLLYVSYSTKETSGSFKHSLSTVPLWGTEAYKKPLPPLGAANQQKF